MTEANDSTPPPEKSPEEKRAYERFAEDVREDQGRLPYRREIDEWEESRRAMLQIEATQNKPAEQPLSPEPEKTGQAVGKKQKPLTEREQKIWEVIRRGTKG